MRISKWIWLCLALTASVHAQADSKDSSDQSAGAVSDKLAGIEENLATLNSDVGILRWVKVSGYLQARYEFNDTSKSGLLTGSYADNRNANNIYIRRGRLKFAVQPGQTSRYVFYVDASKQSISLKEAYVDLIKPIGLHQFVLTAGQFNWPFGYEIEYSSSQRDFPERSLAENKLFKGERDRGMNVTYTGPLNERGSKTLQLNLGIFQGWGIEGAEGKAPTWYDPSKAKDVIARAKVKLGMIDLGASGYWGKTNTAGVAAVAAKPGSSTWFDANGNNAIDAGEVTTTQPTPAKAAIPGVEKDKIRYGADAQVYLDVLPFGGSAIRGEMYLSKDYDAKAADSLAKGRGWYVWLSQSLGTKLGGAVRYDYWDPNSASSKQNDATGTLSLAANYFWDAHVRVTAAYDVAHLLDGNSIFTKSDKDVKDNRFTLQFQFVF